MPSYSWIKLYHEIIDDPKMGRMSDSLWRRTIELFLLAGRNGNEGLLPSLHDISWALRISDDQLKSDLLELQKVNIVDVDKKGCWHVVNFSKRQAPADVKDRVAQYRDRAKKHGYYEDETQEKQDSNESLQLRYTDTEEDTDKSEKNIKNSADKPRDRDLLFDAIAKVTCTDPATAGASIGKIKSTLLKAKPPYTTEEVLKFGADWPAWKDKPPTLWQLKEQIGIVRNGNGNGHHEELSDESIRGRKVYR